MNMVVTVSAFAFLFLIFSWLITKKRSMITEWPILGMLPGLLLNAHRIHDYFSDVLKLTKHTFEIRGPWFSNLGYIVTSDLENIHYIFSKKFANFNKGPAFKEIFQVLGDGILAADSESWRMQRKLIHSLFRHNDFLSLVDTISKQKVEMGLFKILDKASDNGLIVDMQDLFQRFTLDVTCTFLLGSDLDSLALNLPEIPFAKAVDDIEEVLLHRHLKPKSLWMLQKWLQIGVEKKATSAIQVIDNFVYQQIILKQEQYSQRRTMKIAAQEESFDLISNFMMDEVVANCQSREKSIETFLRDSVMSILSAGRDTTATALTWFFWLVSTNPLVESKIREEIQTTFQLKVNDTWHFPSYQKLNELIYLHAALCETLRLYPPLPFNYRASIEPDILPSGHCAYKNTEIIISMYAMGRMEEIWGVDCCEFKPERWISKKETILDMPSFKYNVFGAGPRACVGKDLAFREMKTVAAAIIWNYNIKTIKDHQYIPANSVILHMQHGLKVNVAKKVSSENSD